MAKKDDYGSSRLVGSGLEIGVGVALGVIVGMWFDSRRHSSPWGVVIGAVLGFASGFYLLVKAANKANKD